MLIVDSLLVSGIKFVLTRLAEAVEAEMYDEGALREELLAAQMKHELGEIDDEELDRIESVVLSGLREIGERKRAAGGEAPRPSEGGRLAIESVEANVTHEAEEAG